MLDLLSVLSVYSALIYIYINNSAIGVSLTVYIFKKRKWMINSFSANLVHELLFERDT
jgi:hypothetical protein